MAGAEVAAILWPILKVLGIVATVFGILAFLVGTGRRQGRAEADAEALEEADDARMDFERLRQRRRQEALARLRDRARRMRGSQGPGGDAS